MSEITKSNMKKQLSRNKYPNNHYIDSMVSNAHAVKSHYNSIKEVSLYVRNESNILYLRNFNNWIKSVLIENAVNVASKEFKGISVLDMGSGKGGDQLKWAQYGVSHVSFMDIAQESVKQSKERFSKRKFSYTADFFVADFTKDVLKSFLSRQYQIISCQFAFHYSFESYKQANLTFKNVSDQLSKNGYFIGTTVNSFELIKRMKRSYKNSFGNDIYKVTFPSESKIDNIPLFGAKYNFYLEGSVDCPEFVVHPQIMDHLALQNKMELILRCSLPEFYEANIIQEKNKNLLTKCKALQDLQANMLHNISRNKYSLDKKHIDPSKIFKVSTISKSEWEVIQLYDVFIYQKV